MQVVIDISEEMYEDCKVRNTLHYSSYDFSSMIASGKVLPKGHGNLIDYDYLLNSLRCDEYETCCWRNCSECNRAKCITEHNIVYAPIIVKADKGE